MAEARARGESGAPADSAGRDALPQPGPGTVVYDGPDYRLLLDPFRALTVRWRQRSKRSSALVTSEQERTMAEHKTSDESADARTGAKRMSIDDVLDLPPPGPADIISESGFATKIVRPTEDGKGDRIVRI